MKTLMTRRAALKITSTGTLATALSLGTGVRIANADPGGNAHRLKGRIHHSVCRWCYQEIPLDNLCRAGQEMGLVAIDLLDPAEFPVANKYGLICSMVAAPVHDGIGGIPKAFNRLEFHDTLARIYEQRINETSNAACERLICFSGNRNGLDDEKGLENCVTGLKRILALAEKRKVTLCMELLNSKHTHPDYQGDHVAWGVELVKRISSERFKLLYDIFHMQIMDGDVCDTIRDNCQFFDHYHTGGVPGRGEIDGSQELNYSRIMQAILDSGFTGFVAQEFVPKRPDKIASLREGVELCDV
jgi:hydroxypyruvate isomerase